MSKPRRRLFLITVLAVILVVILAGLGIWQVQRLAWKTDLIARTEAQLSAPPTPAPAPDSWSRITTKDEYRRVSIRGTYLRERDVLVKAVTEYGAGFWVMTPLRTSGGWSVWINRGFVPQERRGADQREFPSHPQTITGLLRISKPGGAFLQANAPDENRWYSRDITALSQSQNIANAAPYFIDAARDGGNLPIGGLTVVNFRNAHLSYALTWFAMAAGLAVASFILLRREWMKA